MPFGSIDWPIPKSRRACACGSSIFGEGVSAKVGGWLNTIENAGWASELAEGFRDWNQWYHQFCSSDWNYEDVEWNGAFKFGTDELDDNLLARGIVQASCPVPHSDCKYPVLPLSFSFAIVDLASVIKNPMYPFVRASFTTIFLSPIDEWSVAALMSIRAVYGSIRRHTRRRYLPTSKRVIARLTKDYVRDPNSVRLGVLPNDVEAYAWMAWRNHWENCYFEIDMKRPLKLINPSPYQIVRAMRWLPANLVETERLCAIVLLSSFHNTVASFRKKQSPMEERLLRFAATQTDRLRGIVVLGGVPNRETNKVLLGWRSSISPRRKN